MADDKSLDKRMRQRLPLSLPARIQPLSRRFSRPVTFAGRTRDISNAGAYLWCEEQLAPGELLQVSITVPPDLSRQWTIDIECEAEVVRLDPRCANQKENGIGMRIRRFRIPKVMALPETVSAASFLIPTACRWIQ